MKKNLLWFMDKTSNRTLYTVLFQQPWLLLTILIFKKKVTDKLPEKRSFVKTKKNGLLVIVANIGLEFRWIYIKHNVVPTYVYYELYNNRVYEKS